MSRTLEELQKQAWEDSLGYHLSSYPFDQAPEVIVERLYNNQFIDPENEDNEILPWEPFEGYAGEWLAERIETSYQSALIGYKWAVGIEE